MSVKNFGFGNTKINHVFEKPDASYIWIISMKFKK